MYAHQSPKEAKNGKVYRDRHAMPPHAPKTKRDWYQVAKEPAGTWVVSPAPYQIAITGIFAYSKVDAVARFISEQEKSASWLLS